MSLKITTKQFKEAPLIKRKRMRCRTLFQNIDEMRSLFYFTITLNDLPATRTT